MLSDGERAFSLSDSAVIFSVLTSFLSRVPAVVGRVAVAIPGEEEEVE